MIWNWKKNKKQTEEQQQDIEFFNRSKSINAYAFRDNKEMGFGNIFSVKITVFIATEDYGLSYVGYSCNIGDECYEDKAYCPCRDNLDRTYKKDTISLIRMCKQFSPGILWVSTDLDKLKNKRKQLITTTLEELTHENQIARLREQLEEIEEENSDET